MKRFTTFLVTLLLFTLGASAQTDYSSKMDNTTGTAWAHGGNTNSTGVERYSTTAYGTGRVLYQTISGLPAGNYEVEFYAVANMAWISAAYGDNIAQVFANEAVQNISVIANDAADKLKDTLYKLSCTVGVDGILDYGLQNIATGGNWYVCQGVSLILTEASDATLQEGATLHGEDGDEDDLGHWSQTFTGTGTNGGLDYNTWSGESGMTVPYHQVWVGSASTLSDQTISHAQIENLPAGTYTVTVDARVLSEADNSISTESAFFNANGTSVDIVANATTDEEFSYGTATEHEVNGTYTLTATVGDDGTLDISFTIKDATYNWISWKNLSVTLKELAAEEEEPEPEDNSYKFVCTDWVAMDPNARAADTDITRDEDANTITVTKSGANNIALGNGNAYEGPFSTSEMYITEDQKYFTIIGSDVSTEDGASYWWWMNGINDYETNYGQIAPNQVVELEDGQILFAWDISGYFSQMTADSEGKIYLTGWTGFGLTSAAADNSATISDINFYTDEELEAIIGGDEEPGTEEPEPTPEPATLEDGEYLIVNADGNYLGGGLTWGTQAAIIGKPQFIGFEVQDDGTYHLDSHQYNNASAHYLGANLYFDNATPVDWTITEVDGGYTIYGTVDDGTGYLTSNGFQTVPTVEADPYVWTILTKDDVIASMDKATADAPVDVTALITNPELKRNSNTTYYPTWTVTGYDGTGTPSNYIFGYNSNAGPGNCAESYHSTNGFNFSQEITLPKSGTYKLSAQGFYRDDYTDGTTPVPPVLYAGEESVELMEVHDAEGVTSSQTSNSGMTMATAYQDFLSGLYPAGPITITTYRDGKTVTIGFKGEDTGLWNIVGELELLYCGEEEAEPEDVYVPVHECEAELGDYDASVDRYRPAHWTSETASGDEIAIGNFHVNTWSTEDDPSGMVPPFVEYWVGSGNVLSDATISHTTLNVDNGTYQVSVFARLFNEGSSVLTSSPSEGVTFTVNGESVDMTTGTSGRYNLTSPEYYGTYTLETEVEDGKLDIGFNVEGMTAGDWLAWKDLNVAVLTSTADIELTAVEGKMDAEIEEAQLDAVAKFEKTLTADSYYEAVAAIEAAEASVEYYTAMKQEIDAVAETLDEDGTAALEASGLEAAYEAGTLPAEEDVVAALVAAVEAQTTEGADLGYVLANTAWVGQTGTYADGVERYGDEIEVEDGETVKVLYQHIEGLTPGVTYELTFYAVPNNAWVGAAVGDGIAQVYANDQVIDVTVNDQTSCTPSDYSYTFEVTIGEDGVLEYGLQNIATGGNWYVAQAVSLTLVEASEDEDLSELIAQYEADCEAAEELETELADMIENGDKTDETIASMEEALAALEAVMEQYGDIDTDNTTAEELTEAIAAIEAALAEAQDVYTTGLQSITVATEDDAIYTLSGVRVSKAVKGVYIVNGKKVLVK